MKTLNLTSLHSPFIQPPLSDVFGQSAGAYHFGAPFYNPPYESAMQDDFAWHLAKYIREDATLDTATHFHTSHGSTTLDFVLNVQGQKIAFVCMGIRSKEQIAQDEACFGELLAQGKIQMLYRLRGIDLYFHIEDCLYLISQSQPHLFHERGLINLKRLASEDALRCQVKTSATTIRCEYDLQGGEDEVDRSYLPLMENNTHYLSMARFDRAWAIKNRKATMLPLAA